jgi:dihydrofolate reductase
VSRRFHVIGGPDGHADWVPDWSDHYDVPVARRRVLARRKHVPWLRTILERHTERPDEPLPMTGKLPTSGEVAYGRFTAQTPHYVLSSSLSTARWPNTSFLRGLDQVVALKHQPGRDIYLVGGARSVATLLDAGLVDELTLTIHPLLVGQGKPLFAASERRRRLELKDVQNLSGGCVRLLYSAASPLGQRQRSRGGTTTT